ncbi:MAG: HIT family protein [Flexistipes sinusarabici]|uniref:HIT family protein n=1 Tax=Flexistipes sinusarabici TaxID=2352 RepID=A0A5D0MLK8_FLESI|nr:HIT family protein [Flexistipes sinusarabici]TYB32483.1 MAG: HIT family protein [Flexistipes sinusarabici]
MEYNKLNCPFCNFEQNEIILKNKLCYARFDKYPVNQGHLLIIPFRHFDNYFDATYDEKISVLSLLEKSKKHIDEKYFPNGYNVGINIGQSAGQTVMHLHVHLIPRYDGDIDNPTGGVRGVIPNKRIY